MKVPAQTIVSKLIRVFYYLLNTLCLALTAVAIIKYLLDDASWINYFIVVSYLFAALFAIKRTEKLCVK